MKVLALGMDKDLFKKGSPSFRRHVEYAKGVEEYHVMVFSRRGQGYTVTKIAENAWAYPTNSNSVLGMLVDAYKLGRSFLKKKGDWVLSVQDPFESGFIGYLLAKTMSTPLLVQEHGNFFLQPYWRNESFVNKIRYMLGVWIVRHADVIRAVSVRIRDSLISLGVENDRIITTPVYTEVEVFKQAQADPATLSVKQGEEVLILTAGRFVPQKNLSMLIRAFIRALEKGANAKLLLVGTGPEEEVLRTLAKEAPKGSIIFQTWTDVPEKVMKAADVYALSSNYEGWGRVIIEALAAGLPLITTDVGCAGEVVTDGHDTLIVEVNDEWAFSEGLYALSTDTVLRNRLREEGLRTVSNMPTFERNVGLYIESLTTCLNKKKNKQEDLGDHA